MRTAKDLSNWLFSKTAEAAPAVFPAAEPGWEKVSLPHTWNAVDGQIGTPFERGAFWYVTTFEPLTQPIPGGRLYVEVGACALRGEIWVNGKKVTEHVGGYSAFRADITGYLRDDGPNVLAILADNTYSDQVYPQRADFTFYGGLYRYVRLISVPASSFSMEEHGGPGVYIDAVPCGANAEVSVKACITNPQQDQRISVEIFDKEGKEVCEAWCFAEETSTIKAVIPDARIWNGVEDPYLYHARLRVVSFNEVVDEICVPFGVLSFSVDKDQGFILNGRSVPLRGVCRHQDRLYEGCALSPEEGREDMQIIADMGANAVRLAHYQQAQEIYDICDELGLVVWAEIPYFAQSWDDQAHASAVEEIKELVAQNYNHPSICFWGLSNEILMAGNDNPKLLGCHEDLNRAVKELDQKRLTVIAHEYGAGWDHALHDVSDAEGWNHYFGWYRGVLEDLAKWSHEYHEKYPERRFAITEYGCDSIIGYHSDSPVKMDYSEEYQVLIHESACETLATRPWIWGSFVWNMFDFGSYFREEGGTKGRNNKGLVTIDRKIRKDSYYVYKAWFSKDPFVHVCGRRYFERPGESTTIRVHSNQKTVSLYADGQLIATLNGEHVFIFENVPISQTGTLITAVAGDQKDAIMLRSAAEKNTLFTFPGFQKAMDAKNWFEGVDDIAGALENKEGFYSINDPMNEIVKNEKAKTVIIDAFIAISERTLPESLVLMGDLSLPAAEYLATGFCASLLGKKRDTAIRRIHGALSQIPKTN